MIVYTSHYGRDYTESEIKYEVELWIEQSKIYKNLNVNDRRKLVNSILDAMYRSIWGETVYSWLQSLTSKDIKHLVDKIINHKIKNVV